jgi:hypothetical protein
MLVRRRKRSKLMRTYLIAILVAVAGSPATNSAEAVRAAQERCFEWLRTRSTFSLVAEEERVAEFQREGRYVLRSNLRVSTILGGERQVGFECSVAVADSGAGELVADASSSPYPKAAGELPERLLRWAGSGCPDVESWKKFAAEMNRENYKAALPSSCRWLERGARIFGPARTVRYEKLELSLAEIVVADGARLWVEAGNL